MKIIQGGAAGVAAQFEAAGIEVAPKETPLPATETKTPEEPPKTAEPLDDTTEDENGLTALQRAELTKKHQRAIGRKHAQLKEAEALARTEYEGRRSAEERVETLQKELDDLKKAAEKAKEPIRPKRDSFETQEAYEDALLAYGREIDKLENAKKAETERETQRRAHQEAVTKTAGERISRAREMVSDYDEVVGAANMIVPDHIAEYMQESELFAELGYHFAQHPEDLERLAKLPCRTYADVQRLGVAIAKIEGKIKPFSETHKATEKTSNGTQPNSTDGTPKTETSEAKPNPTASAPSKRPAPVITPLPTGSGSGTESAPRTQKEHVQSFGKQEGRDLYARKRH